MQVPTRPGRTAAVDRYTAWLCVCFCTETLFSMYVAVPMIPYHGPRSQRRCNARPKFNARIFFLTHITASLCSATLDRTSALSLEAILRVINKAYECKGARRRIDREEVAVSSVMAGTGGRASPRAASLGSVRISPLTLSLLCTCPKAEALPRHHVRN